jgi:hypothetical protein
MKEKFLGSLLLWCVLLCATPHNKKKAALILVLENKGVVETAVSTIRPQVPLKHSYKNRFARLRNSFVSGDADAIRVFYEQGFLCTEQEIFYALNYPINQNEQLNLWGIYLLMHLYQPELFARVKQKKEQGFYPRPILIYTKSNGESIKNYSLDRLVRIINGK